MIIRDRIVRYLQKHGPSGSRAISIGIGKKPTSVGPELYTLVKQGALRPMGSRRMRTYAVTRTGSNGAYAQTRSGTIPSKAAKAPTRAIKRAPYERTAGPTADAPPLVNDQTIRDILSLRLKYHEGEVARTKTMLETLA